MRELVRLGPEKRTKSWLGVDAAGHPQGSCGESRHWTLSCLELDLGFPTASRALRTLLSCLSLSVTVFRHSSPHRGTLTLTHFRPQ